MPSTPHGLTPVPRVDVPDRRRIARGTGALAFDVRQALTWVREAQSRREIVEIALGLFRARYAEVHLWLVRGDELRSDNVNTLGVDPIAFGGQSRLATLVERGASTRFELSDSPIDRLLKFRLRGDKITLLTLSRRGHAVAAITGSHEFHTVLGDRALDALGAAISVRFEDLDA
jgi:hypothetical protein